MSAALFVVSDPLLVLPKGHAFIKLAMRVGFANQDEVEALLKRQRAKGLLAIEIITKQGVMRGEPVSSVEYPAFTCCLLTVLFIMSILRHDILWG